eukprot:gene661-8162_t
MGMKVFVLFLILWLNIGCLAQVKCVDIKSCRECTSRPNCNWCLYGAACRNRNFNCPSQEFLMSASTKFNTVYCKTSNITKPEDCALVQIKVVNGYDTETTNMVRPLSTQPTIKFENYSSLYMTINKSSIQIGTYFHQKPSDRVDSIYGSSGISAQVRNSTQPYQDEYQFTDLIATGFGGPYKLGFLLSYQDLSGKEFCIATISNQDLYINPVLFVVYSSWIVWTGFGLFIGSFFFIVLFSCVCFKHRRKFYAYGMTGKYFQREYGTNAEIHCRFNIILFVCYLFISLISMGTLFPLDYIKGPYTSKIAGDIASFSPAAFPKSTNFMWVHVGVSWICALTLFIISIVVQCILSRSFKKNDHIYTILLKNIPMALTGEDIKRIFETEYGEDSVKEVNELYDLHNYIKLWKKRYRMKQYAEVDASIEDEVEILTGKIKEMTESMKKLGKAFVTFSNSSCTKRSIFGLPPELKKCSVNLAHDPGDIIWNNFHISFCNRFFRIIISYIVTLFVILFVTGAASFALYLQIILIFDSTQITGLFGTLFTVSQTKKYLTPEIVKYLIYLLELSPYVIVFITNSMDGVIKAVTKQEKHVSRNSYYTSLIIKLIIFLFCNITLPPFFAVYYVLGQKATNYRYNYFLYNFIGLVVCQIIVSQTFFVKCARYIKDLIKISISCVRLFPCKEFYRYHDRRTTIFKTFIKKRNPKRVRYEFIYGMARNLNILVLMFSMAPLVPSVLIFGLMYFIIDFFFERFHIVYFADKSHHSGNRLLKRIPIILFFYMIVCAASHAVYLQLHTEGWTIYATVGTIAFQGILGAIFLIIAIIFSVIRRRILFGDSENKTKGVSYRHPYQDTMHSFIDKEMEDIHRKGQENIIESRNTLSFYVRE